MPVDLPPPERAIVRAVNVERLARGLAPLRAARGLTRAAESHSRDVLRIGRLDHRSADGGSFARRVARAGHRGAVGEVLAFAPRGSRSDPVAVVRLWMASAPHRAALLDPRYRVLGVGSVRGSLHRTRGLVVTADLAAR